MQAHLCQRGFGQKERAVDIACNCNNGKEFVWTDGSTKVTYKTEVEARAQVIRKGGSYDTVVKK